MSGLASSDIPPQARGHGHYRCNLGILLDLPNSKSCMLLLAYGYFIGLALVFYQHYLVISVFYS